MFKKKKSKKRSGISDGENVMVQLTPKGMAFYLAMKHGVCPKIEGGYDTTRFEDFWSEFEQKVTISFK